jgi:hypothetical protein
MQILFSQDPDEDTDIDTKMALCVARVDFLSHRLAHELLDVVAAWNECLKQPAASISWFAKLGKHDIWVARLIHFSVPVFMIVLSLVVLRTKIPFSSSSSISQADLLTASIWLFVSIVWLHAVTRFSRFLAVKCYASMNEYNDRSPFLLTRGDEQLKDKTDEKNKKKVLKFFLSAGVAFALDVIAGIISWQLSH